MWSRWWVWKTLNSLKEKSEKEKILTFAFYLPLYVLSIFAPRFFNNICFYQDVHGRDAFSDFQHTCEILLETRQYFRISHSLFHTLQLKQSLAITHNFTWTNKVLRNYTKKLTLAKHVKLVITFHTECFPHSSSLAWRHNRQYVGTLQSPLKSRHIDGIVKAHFYRLF